VTLANIDTRLRSLQVIVLWLLGKHAESDEIYDFMGYIPYPCGNYEDKKELQLQKK
jgi:hypothetical protein